MFSGSMCTGGDAQAVVFATGMHTELGRIAALSQGGKEEPSPFDQQVRSVSWLIANVAVALAIAFVPLAIFVTGLSLKSSVTFAVGLLARMVPEGLLPVITLALAVAVTLLARRGAVVKRLSSVETLGSTDVICTDKTGTLAENRMHPVVAWTCAGEIRLDAEAAPETEPAQPPVSALLATAAACSNARLDNGREPNDSPVYGQGAVNPHRGADLVGRRGDRVSAVSALPDPGRAGADRAGGVHRVLARAIC